MKKILKIKRDFTKTFPLNKTLCLDSKEYLTHFVVLNDDGTYTSELKLRIYANASIIGNYTCNATNSEGTDSVNFLIGMMCPPTPTVTQRYFIFKLSR